MPDASTGRRGSILRAVRSAAEPVGVSELAERLAVHPNTIRFHLDALERASEVERAGSGSAGRGRPRLLYRATAGLGAGERRYELLAAILLDGLGTGESARDRAALAGAAWGRRHAQEVTAGRTAPVAGLITLLDDAGFDPRRDGVDAVLLHNCPFRELVGPYGRLACDLHEGMMRGALAEWDAEVTVSALEPFVEPELCRARLVGAEAAA